MRAIINALATFGLLAAAVVEAGVFQELTTPHAHEIMRQAKSADMRNYMAADVPPCDDFYAHACGNWAKINPANEDILTDQFNFLQRGYMRRAQRLLERPKLSTDSVMETRVKYFYESCLNRTALRLNYRGKLLGVLDEFGGMPAIKGKAWQVSKFDWLEMMAQILRRYGKPTLLGVELGADLSNSQVNRLYIGQQDELITSQALAYYASRQLKLQLELQQMLGLNAARAAKTAAQVTDLEFQLARGISEPLDGLAMEQKTRLRMLDEMSESYKPSLNLTRFISTWLGHEYRLPVYEYVESYLWNLRKLLEKTPKHVLANYMLTALLHDFKMEVAATDAQQRVNCVDKTAEYFSEYLDHMVYRSLEADSPSTPASFKHLWQQLKEAFEQLLRAPSAQWLGEETRAAAVEKLKAMSYRIHGAEPHDYEQEYSTLVIGTDDYFENVRRILELRGRHLRERLQQPPRLSMAQGLNAVPAYSTEFNLVLIPAAFMQHRYFWDDVYPAALKYATVGSIIAHEMGHGYDDNMRMYDAKGNLRNWWDRNATEEFGRRKQCLVQQFSEFKHYGMSLVKTEAQDENIADNVGVRIAYTAYMRWLAQDQDLADDTEHLPHMSQTPQQLFFLGLGQLWCADMRHEWRQTMVVGDVHAPEELRLYAMLANFDAFAETHQCRVGAKMNPRQKCVIY